ncbi:SagB/ThcOx family dehydrogenase [Halococcus saccharolyticus]|uniref:SagB-type dehydrogenase domain protein n=1 Tax=Halococcus saccharolyticus DSM 5350 TaxID=1227455 RepID=M0MMX0_9EURY|nr:SagB/ThcOx family dehydrogenase [Halococcus saccharolyticus]EMA46728.1 SagB-type dehydrogenase domain protein [Halococcus saccharolyticus DSM 5350]
MVDAREYHERTKHSPRELRADEFELDFSNRPRPSKEYVDFPRRSLGTVSTPPETPALQAIATDTAESNRTPDDDTLSIDLTTLCHYAAGVTKTIEVRGETAKFRAAACTGKLYHVDLYAITGDLDAPDGDDGTDAGVYHYDPNTDEFHVLREGDYRGVLADATDDHPGVADAPVTLVATSEWWRNAWKYRNRTYRHAFWDSGTVLANLLAVAHGSGHRAEVVTGFADDSVARLLGIDPDDEAPLELVAVGRDDSGSSVRTVEPIDPIDPETRLASDPVDYPLLSDAWHASTLSDGEAAAEWRERFVDGEGNSVPFGTHPPGDSEGREASLEQPARSAGDGERIALDPVDEDTASARPVANTIERRGSLREYSHEPISSRKFATVLDRALGGVPLDCFGASGSAEPTEPSTLVDAYCLVHAVEGIPSGAYQYYHGEDALERIGDTDREIAGHLALDQSVVGDAAVNVYLMADVGAIVEAVGNRGYRVAQLAAGIRLGRLYLATYSHRTLGGRGFTFYDDRVTEHLSPRAANQTPMTLFALGKPAE